MGTEVGAAMERRVEVWFVPSGIVGGASRRPSACTFETRASSSFLCPLYTSHRPLLTSSKQGLSIPTPTLTDAFVHVGVSGIKVSRRAGRQADAHLADVVPLQQNEQLGRALEAAVDF